MRIRNPPKCIMSISVIMSLLMTLLVFQCTPIRALSLRLRDLAGSFAGLSSRTATVPAAASATVPG